MSQEKPEALTRDEIERALRQMGEQADVAIDLGEAALLLAALGRPRVPLDRYRHHLDLLAREVAARAKEFSNDDVKARAQVLGEVIADDHGYAGDRQTYDDPQNANLMRVIDRKRGLPVALTLLYLLAARAQGWKADALAFPGHVLFRLEEAGERLILDPFDDGRTLGPADLRQLLKGLVGEAAELSSEHTRAMSNREILLRLQNNLKGRSAAAGDKESHRRVLDSMLWIAPGDLALWVESAGLHEAEGNLIAARQALEKALALPGDSSTKERLALALQRVRTRMN